MWVDRRITIRVQRIDQSRLGWMQRFRQPLTRTVSPHLFCSSTALALESLNYIYDPLYFIQIQISQ